MRTTLCSSLTRCISSKGFILFAVALLALAVLAPPASAQTCLQDEYNLVQKQKLNCTANDVRVAKVINIRNLDGTSRFTCTGGETFSFVADFLVQTTSSQARSNIGLYFATSDITNQPDALTGSCADNIIAPPHKASDTSIAACFGSGADLPGVTACGGFGTYEELDTGTKSSPGEPSSCNTPNPCTDQPTGCGDTTSNDATICLSAPDTHGEQSVVGCTPAQKRSCTAANNCFAGTQVVTVEIPSFTCPQAAAGTAVTAGDCTSWQEPGGAISCIAKPQDYQYPFNGPGTPPTPTAIPGSPSKCNCEQITLPLIVQTPNFIVQKTCNVPAWKTGAQGSSPNPPSFNPTGTPVTQSPTTCDAGPEGNFQLVTYTINIHNSSTGTGGVTVQQVCDSEFGTIYRSGTYTGSACSAGSGFLGTGSISCPSSGSLDIPFGGNVQCTFTSTPSAENLGVGTNASLSDTASAVAVGDVSHSTVGPFSSNTVDVDTEDAPTSAETTPSPNALAQVCARETFHATVANKSGASTDETIFISALHDSAPNDLTTVSAAGPIVGTTCGVSTSLGTLSSSPAVPFPSGGIAPGGNYQCDFDVFFCAAPTTVEAYGTGQCNGNAITPGTCQNPGGPAGSCTTNAQCDTTCTGISRSETLNATLAGDDAADVAADVISPITNHAGNVSVCVQTDTSIN